MLLTQHSSTFTLRCTSFHCHPSTLRNISVVPRPSCPSRPQPRSRSWSWSWSWSPSIPPKPTQYMHLRSLRGRAKLLSKPKASVNRGRSCAMSTLKVVPAPGPKLEPPAHHVGSPPKAFTNPWSSFNSQISPWSIFKAKFGSARNFVPVPEDRSELVGIQKPTWGAALHGLKVTWLGHACFLVETSSVTAGERGIRILFDPVFSERTSPVQWLGPKRYSPTPCTLEELPNVDAVVISHNHYEYVATSSLFLPGDLLTR